MNELGYVAIYARQSIFKADSISVDTQIESCKTLVPPETPIKVYSDKGYTGANTNRPDFQKMLADIKAGLIKQVLVWKLDRISRSVADFATMLDVFKNFDVGFKSYEEPELSISDTGFGKAMLQIVMIFAELERDSIQLRVRENYYSRLECGMLGGGAAPFGYQRAECYINGKKCYMYVPDEEKSKIVQYLYEIYANSEKSLGFLVKWLNDSGIKTNRGHFWNSNALSTMLKNPAFVKADATIYTYYQSKGVKFNNPVDMFQGENGLYLYGNRKIKGSDKKRFKYSDFNGDFVTIAPHLGIVSSEIWLQVQQKLSTNSALGSSGTSQHSWLTGFCKCGYCGKAVIFTQNRGIVYISCLGRRDKHCYERKRTIRAEQIEAEVEKALLSYIKSLPVKAEKAQKKNLPEINKIQIEIAKIDESIDRYLNQLEFAEGALIRRINDKVNQLDKQRQLLGMELTRLTVDSSKPVYGDLDLDDVLKDFSSYSIPQKKAVCKVFLDKVTVWDDKLDIKFAI
ncbi:recombinase family protein [Butyricicoccus faecihominis]|uniref:recombinase family protein n=1 Tax=Butyricicoccus faecihominis TaxID=1712515 RepID=UPI00247910FC|nr:recombinase family protein [Butyricicoccus faecihominis]MCQ5129575.1 recombinase family protein [Butyricicoccus faecihominis]